MAERILTCNNPTCENYKLTITIHGDMQLMDGHGGYMDIYPYVVCQCGVDAIPLREEFSREP